MADHVINYLNKIEDPILSNKLKQIYEQNQELFQRYPARPERPFHKIGDLDRFLRELFDVVESIYDSNPIFRDLLGSKDRVMLQAFLRSLSVLGMAKKKTNWAGIGSEYEFEDRDPLAQVLTRVIEFGIPLDYEMVADLIEEDSLVSMIIELAIETIILRES